jgi:hypothetical protein
MLDRLAHPDGDHRLLFSDTLYEDADTYRFLIEAAAIVTGRRVNWSVKADDFPDYRAHPDTPIEAYAGNPEWRAYLADLRLRAMGSIPELVWIVEGRDPWEVYRDERFVGNASKDPCSKILKRQFMDRWRAENCDPSADTFAVGIDENERHRLEGADGKPGLQARMALQGWAFHSPLLDDDLCYQHPRIAHAPLGDLGIAPPRLYGLNYKHGNCGGFCNKAGLAHWQNRFIVQPERYAYDALMERKVRGHIGNPAATILRDRRGGVTKPMSLDAFAARLRASPQKKYAYAPGSSGCGCATDEAS